MSDPRDRPDPYGEPDLFTQPYTARDPHPDHLDHLPVVEPLPDGEPFDAPDDEPRPIRPSRGPGRGKLVIAAVGAAVLVGSVLTLRSGVESPPPSVGPDGQQIRAYHDARFVVPPARPESTPAAPGELRFDTRAGAALVSWPNAPYGFEVRWGRAGGALDQVRYVATSSTSLLGLDPGRYRVEVRSVDDIGQRSEPAGAEIDVSDDAPEWQRGYGFLEDFTRGAQLDPDRWIASEDNRDCLRREATDGPLLLSGRCYSTLRPSSKLELSEPGADGLRGKVVLLVDAPPSAPRHDRPEGGGPPGDANEFMMIIGPPHYFGPETLMLRVGLRGAYLAGGSDRFTGTEVSVDLGQDGIGGPGALHRWELHFASNEVRALRNGEQVGSIPFRPTWREADVGLTSFMVVDDGPATAARVGLLGLTGPAPDGQPTEVVRPPTSGDPAAEHRVRFEAIPTAEEAKLIGFVASGGMDGGGEGTPGEPPPAPVVVGEFAGRPVELRRVGVVDLADNGYAFEADIPPDLVRAGGELVMRSADGSSFAAYDSLLEVQHKAGTALRSRRLRVDRPTLPAMATPDVVVRQNGRVVSSGQRLRPGEVEVEIDTNAAMAQAVSGGLVGWVALRVDLDGKRILDHPTGVAGPSIAGRYRFVLKVGSIPGRSATMTVSLVPDRAGVAHTTDRFTVRVTD